MFDIKEQYKTSFYFPVLDCFISQLKHRISSFNLDIMNAIQACSPQSTKFLDSTTLTPLVTLYNFDSAAIANEALLAKNTLSNCSMELHNIKDVIKQLMPLKPGIPNIVNLLIIASTIAVSSATCERSFSALKRIKTYLRSTMGQQRLTNLALLSIEKDLTQELSLESFVDEFSDSDQNHRIMLN